MKNCSYYVKFAVVFILSVDSCRSGCYFDYLCVTCSKKIKNFCPVTFHMQIPHSSSAELNK